jgi:hypothetical protein
MGILSKNKFTLKINNNFPKLMKKKKILFMIIKIEFQIKDY